MEHKSYDSLPTKIHIQKTYESYAPYFHAVMENIQKRLEGGVTLASPPMYKARIKSFDSYYKKILRLKEAQPSDGSLICLTDMIGIRIICAFLEDLSDVSLQVRKLFDVREIEQKGPAENFKAFEYESIHILVKIPDSCYPPPSDFPSLPVLKGIVCEIQIRTILQDAWAEVEHELVYKSEFSPFDLPLRRKLASINASLTLADTIFQEIRDYQKKLQGEVNERRKLFYEKVDELDAVKRGISNPDVNDGVQSSMLRSVCSHKALALDFNPPCYDAEQSSARIKKISGEANFRTSSLSKGTIDDLLLEAIHAHNTGDLAGAIEIYTQIIESKPVPSDVVLSVIHKHRGMAYFTDSEYQKALEDFKASFTYNPKNFRALYYEGIVHGILGDNDGAIDCFSRSLSINEYQSHAFYHRSKAYYEKGEYESALSDIRSAKKLGINDDACNVLFSKIMDKM